MAQNTGQKIPDKIYNSPKLTSGLEFYWTAFWDLASDRDFGMSEGPIPWTAMNDYALRYSLSNDEFDRLCYIIKAMDKEYLKHRDKETKSKINKANKSSKRIGSK